MQTQNNDDEKRQKLSCFSFRTAQVKRCWDSPDGLTLLQPVLFIYILWDPIIMAIKIKYFLIVIPRRLRNR